MTLSNKLRYWIFDLLELKAIIIKIITKKPGNISVCMS